MRNKKNVKTDDIINSKLNLRNTDAIENQISTFFTKEYSNKLNNNSEIKLINNNGNIEFVSIAQKNCTSHKRSLTEKEFFKIIGLTKKGLSSKSGKYQESLYNFYLQALQEHDEGFMYDVMTKAIVFDNNLKYVQTLMKNKKFMKEWKQNLGKESPLKVFKNSGSLKKINIINEYIK